MLEKASARPANRPGVKYLDCPFYDDCLTFAARRNWNSWSCEQCPNRQLTSICQQLQFIAPYYRLLAEIYPEFKAKYEAIVTLCDYEL